MRPVPPSRPSVCERLEIRRLLFAGALDTTFSGDGKVELFADDRQTTGSFVAADSVGDTVTLGSTFDNHSQLVITRQNFNGTLDKNFGNGGTESVHFLTRSGEKEFAAGLVVLPNRKILVAARSFTGELDNNEIIVARLNVDGSIDTTFGDHGVTVAATNDAALSVYSMVLQNDGKIVMAGSRGISHLLDNPSYEFMVLRLNSDGARDNTFDGDGEVDYQLSDSGEAFGVAIDNYGTPQTNTDYGHIVVAGTTSGISGTNFENFGIVRLNPDGSLDNTFSSDGMLVRPFQTGFIFSDASGVVIEPSGRIVIAGDAKRLQSDPFGMVLIGLTPKGTFDQNFATNGKLQVNFGDVSGAKAIVIGHTSNLLVTGFAGSKLAIASFSPDGDLTAGFSQGGKFTVDLPGGPNYGASIALSTNNRVVVSGGPGIKVVRFLDSTPTIATRSVVSVASENGPNAAEFLITSDRTDHDTGVFFSVSGTATSPLSGSPAKFVDYTGLTAPPPPVLSQNAVPNLTPQIFGGNIGYVVIPAGAISALVTITPKDDAFVEKDETATFTIMDNKFYTVGFGASQTITILDNDGVAINPTDDAYVRDGASATTNFGSAADLQTKKGASGANRITYFKFDISSFTNAIASVKLRLFGALNNTSQKNINETLYAVKNTTWSESTITYNNRPAFKLAGLNGVGPLATTKIIDNTVRLYEWDVTAYVKAAKRAGKQFVSFALANPSAAGPIPNFFSKESTNPHPQLVETFT